MLTSLTSGIKLNHIKGPNKAIFVFNYSYMVRQLVFEALQDVSRDSELIKYEQKTFFFSLFQVHSIDPYGLFSGLKYIQKGYGTFVTLMERGVEVKKEPEYHHFVAIMETIFGQNPEVCEVKMGFSHRVSHFHARDPHQRCCRIVLNTN